MNKLCDLHIHTTFSDGDNTPEEMVVSAIEKGVGTLGFSDHSYTHFDESYCMKKGKADEYKKEINRLKEKYKDKIKILCGIEQDFYSSEQTDGYDYVIGSVHYVKVGENYLAVDEDRQSFISDTKKYFGGDFYAYAEEYFLTVSKLFDKMNPDIIGHFDLFAKFNEGNALFDEKNPRYKRAWKNAVDTLLLKAKYFEINFGAVSRGYRKTPYPSEEIRRYIEENGGKFVFSSDSHNAENICLF